MKTILISQQYQVYKQQIVEYTGLANDALHVFTGLGVFFLVALLLRLKLSHWLPLLAAICAAFAGEYFDLDTASFFDQPQWYLQTIPQGSVHDLWVTGFWPLFISIYVRIAEIRSAARS